MTHPLERPDPDHGCRWLCLTAGIRTRADEEALARVMETLPTGPSPCPPTC